MAGSRPVAGFDYGTSNCVIGLTDPSAAADSVRMVPLEDGRPLIPSTLYAPKADFELEIGADATLDMSNQSFRDLHFGTRALQAHLRDPEAGFYVKSPKSFLGAPGLSERVKDRFISVVAAMMANVRAQAEGLAGASVDRVVIGRPVNFQGASGDAENQQALTMLRAAAREAGFDEVTFLYEPVAAAFDFEMSLAEEQLVLVVDMGGGTTDCSFVRAGPHRRLVRDRQDDLLGHAGERLGGNDYDQALALASVMPLLGLGSSRRDGQPLPNHYFVDAVSTNDVNAQQRFYGRDVGERLEEMLRTATRPECVRRLVRLRERRGSYQLLQSVEKAKIELTGKDSAQIDLGFLETGLEAPCTRSGLGKSADRLLAHLRKLVLEVGRQAGREPDCVFLTGGMTRSVVVRGMLEGMFRGTPLIDSDHFTSVAQGLTLTAGRRYV